MYFGWCCCCFPAHITRTSFWPQVAPVALVLALCSSAISGQHLFRRKSNFRIASLTANENFLPPSPPPRSTSIERIGPAPAYTYTNSSPWNLFVQRHVAKKTKTKNFPLLALVFCGAIFQLNIEAQWNWCNNNSSVSSFASSNAFHLFISHRRIIVVLLSVRQTVKFPFSFSHLLCHRRRCRPTRLLGEANDGTMA